MGTTNRTIEQADNDMLVRVVMDGFHRILVHYGAWMAEVAHQVGLEQAMAVEEDVWAAAWATRWTDSARRSALGWRMACRGRLPPCRARRWSIWSKS